MRGITMRPRSTGTARTVALVARRPAPAGATRGAGGEAAATAAAMSGGAAGTCAGATRSPLPIVAGVDSPHAAAKHATTAKSVRNPRAAPDLMKLPYNPACDYRAKLRAITRRGKSAEGPDPGLA